MPPLLKSAQLKPDVHITDLDNNSDNEEEEDEEVYLPPPTLFVHIPELTGCRSHI